MHLPYTKIWTYGHLHYTWPMYVHNLFDAGFYELLGLRGYFSVSFKMQNGRYFERSLCQIFGISPEASRLASECAISVQKEGTNRQDLPWAMTDYSIVSHHCHSKQVQCVAMLLHARKFLANNCHPNALIDVAASHHCFHWERRHLRYRFSNIASLQLPWCNFFPRPHVQLVSSSDLQLIACFHVHAFTCMLSRACFHVHAHAARLARPRAHACAGLS